MNDRTKTDPRVAIPEGDGLFDLSGHIVKLAQADQVFSDIMIQENEPIMANFPRGWEALTDEEVDRASIITFISKFEPDWAEKLLSPEGSFDFTRQIKDTRLRFNVYLSGTEHRITIEYRKIPLKARDFAGIGLPPTISKFAVRGKGLVLIVGGTNAGKTTTLAAFIEYINANRNAHVVTIEQPIEYVFSRNKAIFSQKEVPTHVESFALGLKTALRQKPDVLVVGEARDKETVDTMLHAAESGHLVFATFHANSAAGAIAKILSFYDMNEAPHKAKTLASVLIGVICQSLLPNMAGDNYELVYEILENNSLIAQAISDMAKPAQLQTIQKGKPVAPGSLMCVLNEVMAKKVSEKKISQKDAQLAAYDQEDLEKKFRNS